MKIIDMFASFQNEMQCVICRLAVQPMQQQQTWLMRVQTMMI